MVLDLVTQEGIVYDHTHIIWLDNLFTSARLLLQLDIEGFGAAGTVRTTITSREDLEAQQGITVQRKNSEPNRGLDQRLVDLKTKWTPILEWGILYRSLLDDGKVMEFIWKDQNIMLFMSTVLNGRKTVKRLVRARQARAMSAFGLWKA